MKMNYIVFFFVCIQLALSYSNAKLTADSTCGKNGYLVQMVEHYECLCLTGFALEKENECSKIVSCTDEGVVADAVCAKYGTCKADGDALACTCADGFELNNKECVFSACSGVECGNGKCMKSESEDEPLCVCKVGWTLDDDKKCKTEAETKCGLKCSTGQACKKNDNGYFSCAAEEVIKCDPPCAEGKECKLDASGKPVCLAKEPVCDPPCVEGEECKIDASGKPVCSAIKIPVCNPVCKKDEECRFDDNDVAKCFIKEGTKCDKKCEKGEECKYDNKGEPKCVKKSSSTTNGISVIGLLSLLVLYMTM